ncbi:MAG: type IV pilus assembly protein PilM [Candidatus Omnitrophota bacterium]|nr:type IV pilus assembly protein PilM [Candidatus Omnitrophota bacterium]
MNKKRVDQRIKKRISSVLKNIPPEKKSKEPRLKKPIFSIFSRKSTREQIGKLSPLFRATSLKKPMPPDESLKPKFSKGSIKNIRLFIKEKVKSWASAFMKSLGFTRELTNVWGLDIGTDCIKLLKMSHEKEQPVLIKLSCEIIPSRFHNAGPQRSEYIKQILKKMVLKHQAGGEVVNCAISNPLLTVRVVKVPPMAEQEISKAIRQRLVQQYRIDLDKEIARFVILGEKEDRNVKQMQILTITVPREIITAQFNLVKQSGLKPIVIEPDYFSLVFSYLENHQYKPEEVIMLLNIGARYSSFSFVSNGNLNFNRSILFGSNELLSALVNNLNISFQEAEKKLKTFGIPMTDWHYLTSRDNKEASSEESMFFRAMQVALEKIITEFHNTLNFYFYQLSGSAAQKLDKILISGGGSKIKNFKEFLNLRLEIPVETLDSLKNVQIADKIDKKLIEEFSGQLDVVIGLVLRKII